MSRTCLFVSCFAVMSFLLACSMPAEEDVVPPEAPIVTGTTPTASVRPTWTWNVPSDVVQFRYRLNLGSWTETGISTTSFAPAFDLSSGSYLLEVQAADAAGNWSLSGSLTVEVDVTPPSPPLVVGATPTTDTTPTWTWSPGSVDTHSYRFGLDSADPVAATYTTGTSYTPPAPLSLGAHVLYVWARDALGNWSTAVSYTITIVS